MTRFKLSFLLLFMGALLLNGQQTNERSYRILKSQAPENTRNFIAENLEGIKRLKYYKETEANKTHFEAKFKKDKLWYAIAFNKEETPKSISIFIKAIDVPDASFAKIKSYLDQQFSKYRIRVLKQQYVITPEEPVEKTIKKAFQNLLIPEIYYELFVKGKKNTTRTDWIITFDSEGNFMTTKKALTPNFDRVLY